MYGELIKRLRATYEADDITNQGILLEAADAIEELSMKLHGDEAAIAGMKREIERMVVSGNMPRWIPVTERLPEDDIVCILTNGISDAIGYRGKVFGWHLIWTDYVVESEVTHWMPLPEPPKEE